MVELSSNFGPACEGAGISSSVKTMANGKAMFVAAQKDMPGGRKHAAQDCNAAGEAIQHATVRRQP